MLSNDTLDRIIFLFGIKMSQYDFLEDPTFVYKGRLLTINDTFNKHPLSISFKSSSFV